MMMVIVNKIRKLGIQMMKTEIRTMTTKIRMNKETRTLAKSNPTPILMKQMTKIKTKIKKLTKI